MECMGVASGCDYQEAGVASGSLVEYMGMFSRKWVWVESMSVGRIYGWASGFGCKEAYITYPYSLYLLFFGSSIPTSCSLLKSFSLCVYKYGQYQSYNHIHYGYL